MNTLRDVVLFALACICVLIALPLALAFGAWTAELMMRWGLLP